MSQVVRILEKLRQGPCTNFVLANIALQYNRCIFNLREEEIHISAIRRKNTGTWVFNIITPFYKIDFDKGKLKPEFMSKN